jgi:TrmH family RNA methyltransferase
MTASRLITSSANPAYKAWLKLASQPRQVRLQGKTLAEGAHLAVAWLQAERPVEAVLVSATAGGPERDALVARLARQAPVYELAPGLFTGLGLVESGIGLAMVVAVPASDNGPLLGDAIYLDGVQDPGNAGALLRVAAAAGVRHVLASPASAALWTHKVLRAAQGAHLLLDLREGIPAAALPTLGIEWIGTSLTSDQSLWQAPLPPRPLGWVVGAEGSGASDAALAACQRLIRIPMSPGVESLNVATAAAVCLFERQRRLTAAP